MPRFKFNDPVRVKRMRDGAINYSLADKSDPFTFARAMCHNRVGISGVDQQGRDAFYNAEPFQEERTLPDGKPYLVTVYKNVERP